MTPNEIMKRNKDKCGAEIKAVDMILNTIASCEPAKPMPDYMSYINQGVAINQEGINPMSFGQTACKKANYNTAVLAVSGEASVEATQRDFTTSRINQILEKHKSALRNQFFMDSREAPSTARDLVKRVTDGDYILDENKVDSEEVQYYSCFYGLIWGKNKPDRAGYELALEVLSNEAQRVIDLATLSPATELLGILDGFKSWTYKASAKK